MAEWFWSQYIEPPPPPPPGQQQADTNFKINAMALPWNGAHEPATCESVVHPVNLLILLQLAVERVSPWLCPALLAAIGC